MTSRIKLLFIVSSLGFGGAEKHVVALANSLDPQRFQVSLAYLKDDAALLPQVDAGQLQGRLFCCFVARKVDSRAVRQLAAHVDDQTIDMIVCVNTYCLLYASLAQRRAHQACRLVELFHTTELNGLKDQLQMLFYRPFIAMTDMLVYVCENQRTYWRARLLRARQDTVIHNGIDVAHFSDRFTAAQKIRFRNECGFTGNDYVIGLCAAMRPEKAHDDLLQAVARLTRENLPVKCLLVGDGPMRAGIEARIDALGLRRQVVITGFIQDVRLAIAACDAMVIVSHHVETFSIAALEAMALQKPMIMSAIGGADEQIRHGENGLLYPRGEIGALATAVRLLANRQRAQRMGECARRLVEEWFSQTTMVDAYERLFVGMAPARQNSAVQTHAA